MVVFLHDVTSTWTTLEKKETKGYDRLCITKTKIGVKYGMEFEMMMIIITLPGWMAIWIRTVEMIRYRFGQKIRATIIFYSDPKNPAEECDLEMWQDNMRDRKIPGNFNCE